MIPHHPKWLELADAGQLQKVYFVHLDWPGEAIRLHTYIGDIVVDGHVWRGAGTIGALESNGASQVSQKPVITLKLSRVPGEAAGHMTAEGAGGRDAAVYLAAKDPHRDTLSLIGGLEVFFFGRIGEITMEFEEVGDDDVRRFDYSVDVEVGRSPRMPLTYYHSDADQRRRTAGRPDGPDTSLRHLAAAQSDEPVWTPS